MLQTEKEVKRLQDEALREEKRREKEEAELKKQLKKQQEEAEKDQRRREKEEAELRKHLKKQQEEAEKEQRRREKEEAEMKKQSALQKQATIMERFLRSTKSNKTPTSDKMSSTEAPAPNPSCKHGDTIETTTSLMDYAFSHLVVQEKDDLFKLHVAGRRKLNKSNRSSRWGVRRNLKIEVVKELKLQGSSLEADTPGKVTTLNVRLAYNKGKCHSDEQNDEKLVDGWEEAAPDDTFCQFNAPTAQTCAQMLIRKLLQFDKSPRPAYYGTWCKKSSVVRPKCPLKKDPNLDYDVDSDEEWEEEEPGESLSDCDKDEEEENLEEAGHPKSDDEDESEDGFFVPDGYLSENEANLDHLIKLPTLASPFILPPSQSSIMGRQTVGSHPMQQCVRFQRIPPNWLGSPTTAYTRLPSPTQPLLGYSPHHPSITPPSPSIHAQSAHPIHCSRFPYSPISRLYILSVVASSPAYYISTVASCLSDDEDLMERILYCLLPAYITPMMFFIDRCLVLGEEAETGNLGFRS